LSILTKIGSFNEERCDVTAGAGAAAGVGDVATGVGVAIGGRVGALGITGIGFEEGTGGIPTSSSPSSLT